jgi:threonine aldolase
MDDPGIDLICDTLARSKRAMATAIAEAEGGSSRDGEDPTVKRWEATTAGPLDHEAEILGGGFPAARSAARTS